MNFHKVIAIDWSGSRKDAAQRQKIWACKARIEQDSFVVDTLECGKTREEVVAWLNFLRAEDPSIVVGLDFAFSFPANFHGHDGIESRLSGRSWRKYLAYAKQYGEGILETCPAPFWGHAGRKKPDDLTFAKCSDGKRLRLTESIDVGGSGKPKQVFQIGGAGSVGTGSLRGMPVLSDLRSSGWSVWPFEEPTRATIAEIYPGCLYDWNVKKSDVSARERYLKKLEKSEGTALNVPDRWLWARAIASDDAFDAFISCIAMARAELKGGLLSSYQKPVPRQVAIEGWIWGRGCW